MRKSPIPTYRTAADVLSRKNGAGLRLLGWTVARTLLIAPPFLLWGVSPKQAWGGAVTASALISLFAMIKIFDARTVGLGNGSCRSRGRQLRCTR